MKSEIKTKDAKKGGYLVGKPHSEGGIKGINTDTGEPIEVEGGEVVITKPAVQSQEKYMFEGKEMTPKEILSKLNSDHGGVAFEKGGKVESTRDKNIGNFTEMKDSEVYLAPNGKPSNLTPEQWHLVRTPEFKNYFGDWENDPENASQIVDENGEPQVMFHQTTIEAKENLYDTGIFMGGLESAAKNDQETPYGFFFKRSDKDIGLKGKEQINVFLNARNVLSFKDRQYLNKYFADNAEGYMALYMDYHAKDREFKIKFDEHWKAHKSFSRENKKAYEQWSKESDDIISDWGKVIDAISVKMKILITDYLKANNFDAMVIEHDQGSFGRSTDTTIVFNSNQIKLADGTNTTFDPNNPDIRYEDGGEIKPIGQLGTGANIYFESKKYRVNDNLRKGNILLNVGSRDSEYPLANVYFDNANEAVFVAKKLEENAPEGLIKDYHNINKIIENFKEEYKQGLSKKFGGQFHLGGDMSKHPAPNGQHSDLTHKQWHFVRGQEFLNWYGDWLKAYEDNNYDNISKTLNDVTEEPLVLYSNSPFRLTQWLKGNEPAAFFVDNKFYAQWFNEKHDKDNAQEFFVEMKEPIDMRYFGLDEYPVAIYLDYLNEYHNVNLEQADTILTGFEQTGDEKMELQYLSKKCRFCDYIRHINPNLLGYLRKSGNGDGVIFYENNPEDIIDGQENLAVVYAVFNPEQIKAASDNLLGYVEEN